MQYEISREEDNLSEEVRRRLEEAILTGVFGPHERLPIETELSKSFGVSRTVIREAVNKLKAQGFLQSIVGRGTFVLPYDFSHVNTAIQRFGRLNTDKEVAVSLLDLRLLIELESGERLAKEPKPEICAELRKTVQQMEELLRNPRARREDFVVQDALFHETLVRSAGNPLFEVLLKTLRGTINYPLDQTHFPVPPHEVMQYTHDHHARILAHIEAGQPEETREAIREHLTYAVKLYLNP